MPSGNAAPQDGKARFTPPACIVPSRPPARTPKPPIAVPAVVGVPAPHFATHAIIAAFNNRKSILVDSKTGLPRYDYVCDDDTKATVVFQPEDFDTNSPPPQALLDALLRKIQSLPERTPDVLVCAAEAWRRCRGKGVAWLTTEDVLSIQGIKKRKSGKYTSGYSPELYREVHEAMLALKTVYLNLRSVDTAPVRRRGRPRQNAQVEVSAPLLCVTGIRKEEHDGAVLEVAWRFAFNVLDGLFPSVEHFVLVESRLLRYDAHREKWERRLGLYGMLHLRLTAAAQCGRQTMTRPLGEVLEHIGLDDPVEIETPNGKRRAKERLFRALNRLVKDRHFGAWSIDGLTGDRAEAYVNEAGTSRASHWGAVKSLELTIRSAAEQMALFPAYPETKAVAS